MTTAATNTISGPRLLRMAEVLRRTGLSMSGLNRLRLSGDFCTPIKLGKRSIRWLESEVDAWILARAQERTDG